MASLIGWVLIGQVMPGSAGAQNPKDAVEDISRISPRSTTTVDSAKRIGNQRFESGRVRAMDDGEPPYHRIAEVWFESAERMGEAMSSPEGQAATADLPNFATGGATFFVSEV